MLTIEARRQIWSKNIPPPRAQPFLYDALVTLELGNITVLGEVSWSHSLSQYVWQLAEKTSDTTYKLFEMTLPSKHYLEFRDAIRILLGVYVTRGIYDRQCPPVPFEAQLPPSLQCTIVNVK